jgi:hypothetical protein
VVGDDGEAESGGYNCANETELLCRPAVDCEVFLPGLWVGEGSKSCMVAIMDLEWVMLS